MEKILLGLALGFPFLGALYLLIFKPAHEKDQRLAAALAFAGASLASLARFFFSGQAVCTFQSGPEGCLQSGVLALSVILLNGISLYLSLVRGANHSYDYEFYTLLNTAWGAAALVENWVISMAALSLGLIVLGHWVRARGGSVGFFASQDDYKDDIGPPRDQIL